MRILLKLAMKFATLVIMVVLMGGGMKYGQRYMMQATGAPQMETPQFSSEEADLMSTVFQSALRLFSGSAKRDELASELSDKLYAGRADAETMSELGIELVKPGGASSPPDSTAPAGGASVANLLPGGNLPKPPSGAKPANSPNSPAGAKPAAKLPGRPGESPAELLSNNVRTDLLGRIWGQVKPYRVELMLVPVVFMGMVLVQRIRGRRRSPADDFMLPELANLTPTDAEPFDMKHAVHSLNAEDFELLVALIYQRQGYRVSMPAGLSGGRGGDFTLARKSERLLVQCKKLSQEHRVPVERVRELHEAMTAAGVTRGLYVASCGFSWDGRNFAKANQMTLINARTLDELLTAAREKPGEDLLAVSQWVPKLMSKVQMTPPHCPTCEAAMDQINASNGSVWVCSQRPECRGRRSARKHQKPAPAKPAAAAAQNPDMQADEVNA